MLQAPRVIHAKRSEQARVHLPGRTLPIIVVPEMLCTRLTDPDSGELVWNPKGSPFGQDPHGFKVDVERLSQMSAELVPDETHVFPTLSENQALPQVRHGRSMLLDVYRTLVTQLRSQRGTVGTRLGVRRALYFCGYDFRQDNARSALRLAEMVEEALDETGERKVVLIGHGMGGLICRYYCRALGGEAKVHQLFLVGSPLLGMPSAFTTLKHGVEGMYVREIEDAAMNADAGSVVFECASELGAAASAVATLSSGGGAAAGAAALFGDLYFLLSLAAGRFLSRSETRNFARQMPSLYQMLPNGGYCHDHLHWVLFDPLATGVAPTGFMVPMGTMEITLQVLEQQPIGGQAGAQLAAGVRAFMAGAPDGSPSTRASRNAIPFVQLIDRATRLMATAGPLLAGIDWTGDWRTQLRDAGGDHLQTEAELLMAACMGLGRQAKATFIDCRNPRRLYEDVYTGLLDAVAERPLCAANLALFHRFDEVLTVTPLEEPPESLLTLLRGMVQQLGPLFRWIFSRGVFGLGAVATGVHTGNPGRTWDTWVADSNAAADDRAAQADAERRRRERIHPRAYLPPNSYAIYVDDRMTNGGCMLQPIAFVSNDDSNVVRSAFLPNLATFDTAGDGSLPVASAYPAAALLSRPFVDRRLVSNKGHMQLAAASDTCTFINEQIDAKVVEFCKT
jgi:pimeloyl-ACP methyl ester carboxylesterase